MAAITYGAGTPRAIKLTASGRPIPRRSIWARMWAAFVASRLRQAQREIALHRHLLPEELEAAGRRFSETMNP